MESRDTRTRKIIDSLPWKYGVNLEKPLYRVPVHVLPLEFP